MKKLIICTLYLLSAVVCFGQDVIQQRAKFDPKKLEFGGGLGMSFGSDITTLTIAPQVGYAFTPRLSAGFGVNYSYYSYSSDFYDRLSLNYMGLNVYGRARPVDPIVLQIQPEIYRMWGSSGGVPINRIVPAFLGGAGVIIPLGNRGGGIMMMLYYDLVQDKYSPYGNRLFYSVGYVITL